MYLDEKIHDVRGFNKDETKIKLASLVDIRDRQLFLQVKYTNNTVVGYLRINVG